MDVFPHPFLMAPMAGVTDAPFRARLRRNGARALWTEMISAAAIVRGHKKTLSMADPADRDEDTVIQLFGAKPNELGRAARVVRELGWKRVDFNAGCPVKKIVRTGAGAALLGELERAGACVEALREQTEGMILTVKIRLGWKADQLAFLEAGHCFAKAGVDGLILHGRTRAQGYAGEADWTPVDQLAQAVSIPVAGNGDISCAADAVARLTHHQVAAVMIGRAALGTPWIFRDAQALLAGQEPSPPPTAAVIIEELFHQYEAVVALKGERAAVGEMKKHVAWSTRGVAGATELRRQVMSSKTPEDLREVMSALERAMASAPRAAA